MKIQTLNSESCLNGVRICRGAPFISHLFFADDCLLFFRLSFDVISRLKTTLLCYENIYGQAINYEKSELLCSIRTPPRLSEECYTTLGVRLVSNFPKYLGMPVEVSGNMVQSFKFLIDRVQSRMSSWSNTRLSSGGKEVLIKSVLTAVPNVLCFPKVLYHA